MDEVACRECRGPCRKPLPASFDTFPMANVCIETPKFLSTPVPALKFASHLPGNSCFLSASVLSARQLFKVDIASEIFSGDENASVPPFLVMATDGIWDEASASTVVAEVKDGISKIQAHKRRFAISKGHHRGSSVGSMTFTDGESDSEDESEFCGSGEWAEHGVRDDSTNK